MGRYRAHFTNGEMVTIDFDFDPDEEGQDIEALLEEAYAEGGEGLCHHCAVRFDISDDAEIYAVVDLNSPGMPEIYREMTYIEMVQKSLENMRKERDELRAELTALRSALKVAQTGTSLA